MQCHEAEELLLRERASTGPAPDGRGRAGATGEGRGLELTDAEARLLEEHLAGCERCSRFRGALERVEGFLRGERGAAPVVRDPSPLWERVSRGLLARERSVWVLWVRWAAVAAGAAFVIGLAATFVFWWRVTALDRDLAALKQANDASASARRPQPAPAPGAEEQELAAEDAAGLKRSGRLYQELADFYRVPVLWVAETEKSVEMKLASEPTGGASVSGGEVVLAVVTLTDRRVPSARTSVRVSSRPGERVTATLEGWRPAPGLWHLECVATPTRAPASSPRRTGDVDLSLTVQYADDAGQAALTTQTTLTPGDLTELGSLTASGHVYAVEVVTQRAEITGAGAGVRAKGGTL